MNSEVESSLGFKLVAIFLIQGGLSGLGLFVWLAFITIRQTPITTISYFDISILLYIFMFNVFALCLWHGFGLWRNKPNSIKWAILLFVAQIPRISFAGLEYDFYTGPAVGLNLHEGNPLDMSWFFGIGSAFNIGYLSEISDTYFGINIVAVIIFLYLLFSGPGGSLIMPKILKGEKVGYLKKHGVPIKTKFQNITINQSVTSQGRNPYQIRTQWQNPNTSEIHIFYSEDMWHNPIDYINTDEITVLIERDNPKKYHVDLSFLPIDVFQKR